MTLPNMNEPEGSKEARLTRRDWILLPLLGLLTIFLLLGFTELVARRMFPNPETAKWPTLGRCLIETDLSTGIRAIPNSVCMAGISESGPVEYRFNSCGHRAGMECG